MQKYISVLATDGAAVGLDPLDGAVCSHETHEEKAYGITPSGEYGAHESGVYNFLFSWVLAAALLKQPSVQLDPSSSSPTAICPVGGDSARFAAIVDIRACRAVGYAAPPLLWGAGDEFEDDDAHISVEAIGGQLVEFWSCSRSDVLVAKATVRTRFSEGPNGVVRHDTPNGYYEAMRHADSARIWEAMLREMNSHKDCETWELRPASECFSSGREPIDCMWVYDSKIDSTTNQFKFWKARLVARGDQMVYLRDYLETYSSVVRLSTWRLFLAVCAMRGLVLTGADVCTAYLHAELKDCEVWMKQARGFEETIGGAPALCKLKMAIYGLRQSARAWAMLLISWLLDWGFKRAVSDAYLFVYSGADGFMLLLIWVDDVFIGHSSVDLRARFMKAFAFRFRVKDLGILRQGLGASVTQDVAAGTVSFSLQRFILDAARRFEVIDDPSWADIPVPVALAKECKAATPSDAEVAAVLPKYRPIVGVINFIATFARPDVGYGSHLCSTFNARPGHVHMRLARRILGYLVRTAAMAITYRQDAPEAVTVSISTPRDDTLEGDPHMLVDSDLGIVRSITGWLVMLAGAAVTWAVRAQTTPALSSAEAELYGLSTGVCDLLIDINVLEEMLVFYKEAIHIFTDSRGARLLAVDVGSSARTRHIHKRWYFVQYHVDEKRIAISPVKGCNNHANIMTKAVGGASFGDARAYALGHM